MNQFKQEVLKICVAQICQTIGFQGLNSTPVDVLVDLLHRYLSESCRLTHRYSEHFERTEPNIDDLGLAFNDLGMTVSELEEYISFVDCPPFPHAIPRIPVSRSANLNFLKPGAREILSRPIHIHEHLPPMYPEKEDEDDVKVCQNGMEDAGSESGLSPMASPQPQVKRSSDSDSSPSKKLKYNLEDEGQPVREIVSVMMTTSGFISSAREGKLPEARPPNIPLIGNRSSGSHSSGMSSVGKKKLTMEKIIRHKNSQGISNPKIAKMARIPKLSKAGKINNPVVPKINRPKNKPGSKPLKIPLLKPGSNAPPPPSIVTPLTSNHPPAVLPNPLSLPLPSHPSHMIPSPLSQPVPPKLKMPAPKTNVPKSPKVPKQEKKNNSKNTVGDGIVKPKKEIDPTSKIKEKKEKDPKKKKESKVKAVKKESKKLKESKKDNKKESKKDKEGKKVKEGKKDKKDKEKEKERERELILALAASSAVTVTSIPPPASPATVTSLPLPVKGLDSVVQGKVDAKAKSAKGSETTNQDKSVLQGKAEGKTKSSKGNDASNIDKLMVHGKLEGKSKTAKGCDVINQEKSEGKLKFGKGTDFFGLDKNEGKSKFLKVNESSHGLEKESSRLKSIKGTESLGQDKSDTKSKLLKAADTQSQEKCEVKSKFNKGPNELLQEKVEGKSKLSIFKKINKPKGVDRDYDRLDINQSRDSSPDLMIDESPSKGIKTKNAEEPGDGVCKLEIAVPNSTHSPSFNTTRDEISPPITPTTPRTPDITPITHKKTPEKHKKEKPPKEKKPRNKSKSPRGKLISPVRHSLSENLTLNQPKTPDVLIQESHSVLASNSFSISPFQTASGFMHSAPGFIPNAPGFIPPFSRFPFIPTYSGSQIRPGSSLPTLPDIRVPLHTFAQSPLKRPPDDEIFTSMDDLDNLERPLTPRHDRDSSPLPPPSSQPLRSPSPPMFSATPPRPRTPAHQSPPPLSKIKPEKLEKIDKIEKDKKKEHKKEKKEKDKDKLKKKKEKKLKEKAEKKKEKDKIKLEKKEKKVKKIKETVSQVPKLTVKISPSPPLGSPNVDTPTTPKLVIKSLVKEEEPLNMSISSSSEDQPILPEIAKFSALITRPHKKHKSEGTSHPLLKIKEISVIQSKPEVGLSVTKSEANFPTKGDAGFIQQAKPDFVSAPIKTEMGFSQAKAKGPSVIKEIKEEKEVPPIKIKNTSVVPMKLLTSKVPSDEMRNASSKRVKEKREKKEKKILENLVTSISSNPVGHDSIISHPVVQATIVPSTPLVTNTITQPSTSAKIKKQEPQSSTSNLPVEARGPIGHFVDDQGNEVWICPTCGKQDDGSPMIGCDTCDDWYHWVCVGIQVAPSDDSNWYCPRCLSQHRQRGIPTDKKKRGRKKK